MPITLYRFLLIVLFQISNASFNLLYSETTPADTTMFRDTFCGNQTLIIGNQLFDADNPSGIVRFAAANGGDSIVRVSLVFRFPVTIKMEGNYCVGDTLRINGTPYHAGFYLGEEILEGKAANGCDSIIQINLKFKGRSDTVQRVICTGDTLYINKHAYHAGRLTGTERIKNPNPISCDSIVFVRLTTLPRPERTLNDTLCPGSSLTINGKIYNQSLPSGTEILPGAAFNGCDSLVRIQLVFRQLPLDLGRDAVIAKGDSACITPKIGFVPAKIDWTPAVLCADPSQCVSLCLKPAANTIYQVTATDRFGCTVSDELIVRVGESREWYAPNAFRPDAGENGVFYLSSGGEITIFRGLLIADRWGEILFARELVIPGSPADGWDGRWRDREMPPGIYVFHCEAERKTGERFAINGSFLLVK